MLLSFAAETQVVPNSAQPVRDTQGGGGKRYKLFHYSYMEYHYSARLISIINLYILPAPGGRSLHKKGMCLSLWVSGNLKIAMAWLKTRIQYSVYGRV